MHEILEVLKANLPDLITIAISILGGMVGLLKTKLGKAILEYAKSPLVNKLLGRLLDLIEVKVHALEQSIVPVLKAAAADGKITQEERGNLRKMFLAEVKVQFASWDVLKFLLGWQEAQLIHFVGEAQEAAVLRANATSAIKTQTVANQNLLQDVNAKAGALLGKL